jgi:hypothetical protein
MPRLRKLLLLFLLDDMICCDCFFLFFCLYYFTLKKIVLAFFQHKKKVLKTMYRSALCLLFDKLDDIICYIYIYMNFSSCYSVYIILL